MFKKKLSVASPPHWMQKRYMPDNLSGASVERIITYILFNIKRGKYYKKP